MPEFIISVKLGGTKEEGYTHFSKKMLQNKFTEKSRLKNDKRNIFYGEYLFRENLTAKEVLQKVNKIVESVELSIDDKFEVCITGFIK